MESKITKIETQKNNKDRVNIYINEEYAFSCSSELVYYHKLEKGKLIEEKNLNEVLKEDDYIKAKSAALKVIEKSFKTEKEIYEKLNSKGYNDDIIERVLKFLKEYKFVDDKKYTELYIKEKSRCQGKNKIRNSLLNKGINEEFINDKISTVSEEKEIEVALLLINKKYKVLIKNEDNILKVKRKLYDYLIRNGFNGNVINSVILQTVKEEDFIKEESEEDKEKSLNELYTLTEKRLEIVQKSEKDDQKIKRRIYDYLLRRGYKYDDIKRVFEDLYS